MVHANQKKQGGITNEKYKETNAMENCWKTDSVWVKAGISEKSGKLFTRERHVLCFLCIYFKKATVVWWLEPPGSSLLVGVRIGSLL